MTDKKKVLFALKPGVQKKLRVIAAQNDIFPGDVIAHMADLFEPLRLRVQKAVEAGLIPDNYGSHFFDVAELVLLMDSGSITPQDCYLRVSGFDAEEGDQKESDPKESAVAGKVLADQYASRMEIFTKAITEMVGDGMDIFDKMIMDSPELREELDKIDTGRSGTSKLNPDDK